MRYDNIYISLSIILCAFSYSCQNADNNKKQQPQSIRVNNFKNTDTIELRKWISIPFPLSSAEWEIKRVGDGELGPSDIVFLGRLNFYDTTIYLQLIENDSLNYPLGLTDSLLNNWQVEEIMKYFEKDNKFPHTLLVKEEKCYSPKMFLKQTFSDGFYFVFDNKKSVFLYLITD